MTAMARSTAQARSSVSILWARLASTLTICAGRSCR